MMHELLSSPNADTAPSQPSSSILKYRDQSKSLLHGILQSSNLVNNIETGIFNECLNLSIQKSLGIESMAFCALYVSKARQIIDNLNPKSYIGNKDLLNALKTGAVDATCLPTLSPQELFPANWDKLVQAKKRRDEIQYSSTTQAMTDTYKCRKCGSRKITYYELQIRSADEGFTTFFTCLGCGCKWKTN